jgi:hypothetical protein
VTRRRAVLTAAIASLVLLLGGLTASGAEPIPDDEILTCYGPGYGPGDQWGAGEADYFALDALPCPSSEPYQPSPEPEPELPLAPQPAAIPTSAPVSAPTEPAVTLPPTDR